MLPRHKYTGPYNPLDKQLDENDQPVQGQEPYNAVDTISMHHDICYRDNDTRGGKHKCDDKMLQDLKVPRSSEKGTDFLKYAGEILGAAFQIQSAIGRDGILLN